MSHQLGVVIHSADTAVKRSIGLSHKSDLASCDHFYECCDNKASEKVGTFLNILILIGTMPLAVGAILIDSETRR